MERSFNKFLVPMAIGIWLLYASPARAQAIFSGISSIEAHAKPNGTAQVIQFQADLPFQYRKQIIDRNTVVLRLYNARFAQSVLTSEGHVNLLSDGIIKDIRLKSTSHNGNLTENVQEIVLTGPGLGTSPIQVLGGEELAETHHSPTSHVMLARIPSKNTAHKKSAQPAIDYSNLQTIGANGGIIQDDNHPDSQSTTHKRLPNSGSTRIDVEESTSNAPGNQMAQALPTIIKGGGTDSVPSEDTGSVENRDSFQPMQGNSGSRVYDISEPPQSPVINTLPNYTGGAKPIAAMTVDNHGHPVLIKPKSQPIPEFEVGNPSKNGGYNTLFQADSFNHPRIDRLLSDALGAYKANQFELAQKQIQQALMLDPHNADLLAAMAEVQLKLDQASLAQINYQKANELSPDKYATRYAQVLTINGKRQEAIQILEALYQQNPKQPQVVYMLGTLNEELGKTSQALNYLQQAEQLHPASADIQYNLGLAYELSGDPEQAEKHYRQALSLNPKATDISKALARVHQGG